MAHFREDGNGRGPGRNLGLTDRLGDVLTVQAHPIARGVALQVDVQLADQPVEGDAVLQADAPADGRQGDGPVHGTAVDIQVVELLGDELGDGTLAGPGRAVDGDGKPPGYFALGQDFIPLQSGLSATARRRYTWLIWSWRLAVLT